MDGLETSEYLKKTAKDNIDGKININEAKKLIEIFLRNLLLGESNELKNLYMHIRWEKTKQHIQALFDKYGFKVLRKNSLAVWFGIISFCIICYLTSLCFDQTLFFRKIEKN